MRVSCGKLRVRASAATRPRCASDRPEKKRASARTPAALTGFSLFSNKLLELGELVFLHEDGVLWAGVGALAHVVAIVAQAFLEDRDQVDVDLRMARCMCFVEVEEVRADDVHAMRAVARAERDH